jgi:pimeloyl-ACP methyl ester carboxylesterase
MEHTGEALPDDFHFDGPTLFIRGERSAYITTRDYNDIKEHFPQAVIETVPKAGHWVHADNPKGFSEALLNFLR